MSYPPSPTLTFRHLVCSSNTNMSDWLPRGEKFWYSLGRQSIFAALTLLQIPKGSTVLVPAFQCPSSLDPFIAYGVTPVFYDLTTELSVDLGKLELLIRKHQPKLLMVIHFYGFECNHFIEIAHLAKQYEVLLIEDCAHGLFSAVDGKLLGSTGIASIFSIPKTLPTPSGGLLVLREKAACSPSVPERASPETLRILKLFLYRLEHLSPYSIRTILRSFPWMDRYIRQRLETPLRGLQMCIPRKLGSWSRRILNGIDPQPIVKRRRENYLAILEEISSRNLPYIIPLFPKLPAGICPLGFPILVLSDRDRLLQTLWRIGSPVRAIWDRIPSCIPQAEYPGADFLKRHILMLPVHQSLSIAHAREVARKCMLEVEKQHLSSSLETSNREVA